MNANQLVGALQLVKPGFANAEVARFLRCLAETVPVARTREGQHLLDASDFRAWLRELAEEAEKAA